MLTLKCPATSEEVPTGVPIPSLSALAAATLVDMKVLCPHCGQTHTWDKEDAYLVMLPRY